MHQHFLLALLLLFSFPLHAWQTIDTVANYTQLKLYTGEKDTVYINHPRYYGLFIQDTCTTEDYGTKILATTGCWQRLHTNYAPRFWAIGGRSPHPLIGTVREEVDAINSAAIAAYYAGGDTVEIDSMYPIDRSVFLLHGNTYLGTSDSSGFVRIDPPVTTLKDTAYVNDKKIFVKSNAGFRTLQKINIANDQAFDSIAGFISYTASIAPAIGGDTTIFLSGLSIQRQMQPGDSVSLFFPMMMSPFSDLDSVCLHNLVFDGNRDHYQLNYSWRVNPTISLPTTRHTLIDKCRFYRIPTENVILCGATVRDCSGTGLNGSALHFSCNATQPRTAVLYNDFSYTNQIGDAIMGHSEAGLTFSANVQQFRIAYNRLQQVGEYGVGLFSNDDIANEITDNLLDSPLGGVGFRPFYQHPETNLIYNNKNLHFADRSTDSCLLTNPNLTTPFPCSGNSSLEHPLDLGDTIHIVLDSLLIRNSNENYLKAIVSSYDATYFELVDMQVHTPTLSQFHHWTIAQIPTMGKGLVFDNGHRDGIYRTGNWGYERCGQPGGCTDVRFSFVVQHLPAATEAIACPLESVKLRYDGDLGQWEYPPICRNTSIFFSADALGQPILQGDQETSISKLTTRDQIVVFPNPARSSITIQDLPRGEYEYQIVNSQGQLIKRGTLQNSRLDISRLPGGVYYLRLLSGRFVLRGLFNKL